MTSGKLTFLDKLLPKLESDGHRVLIFSQFKVSERSVDVQHMACFGPSLTNPLAQKVRLAEPPPPRVQF